MTRKAIATYWDQRASLGETAGTPDLILKQLEHRAILAAVRELRPHTVLEVGCGRGELAREIVQACPGLDYLAVDQSPHMIGAAKSQRHAHRLRFQMADVEHLPHCHVDLVITERLLINLPTWEVQHTAMQAFAARLNPGGQYLMCEHSQDGLNELNAVRQAAGLPVMQRSVSHQNRYLVDAELQQVTCMQLVRCERFSGTYYFLSRIVNAWLAQQAGTEPAYDAPVNQLALDLPAMSDCAQGRLWVWQKGSM